RRHAVLHIEPGMPARDEVQSGGPWPPVFAPDRARLVGRDPRFDPEVATLSRVGQALERAAESGAIQVVDTRHRRPVVDLVLPADAAREIDAPHASLAALEAQRLEWNPDLGGPSVSRDRRRDRPHGLPARVDVAAFVGDLGVRLGAGGADDEDE